MLRRKLEFELDGDVGVIVLYGFCVERIFIERRVGGGVNDDFRFERGRGVGFFC